jgi:di/tricarboxylate transporter
MAAFPLAMILLLLGWFIGVKVIFPMKPEERKPQIEGGMERLREELESMGKVRAEEYKSIAIFLGVLIMWVTESLHGTEKSKTQRLLITNSTAFPTLILPL